MDHPTFLRPLGAAEDDRARRYYEALIPILELQSKSTPGTRLERTRVLNQQGGLNWSEPDHLIALAYAAESIEEDEAWLVVPHNEGLDRAAVNLHELAALVARHDLVDPDVFDAVASGWSEEVIDMLAPPFVSEWTLVSTTGSWIFSTWNAGDLSAIASSRAFLQTYEDRRPSAPLDVVTWILTQGETVANDDPGSSAIGELRKNIARADYIFADSPLGEYLVSLYGETRADEIWSVAHRVLSTDTRRALTPDERQVQYVPGMPLPNTVGSDGIVARGTQLITAGTADERLGRLVAARPELRARLLEIWNG